MGEQDQREGLRGLPSVDRLLREPAIEPLLARYHHNAVVVAAREALADARERILAGESIPTLDGLLEAVRNRAEATWGASLVRVINATGVIIHTNLGRTPLSSAAIEAMAAISQGYSNLEYDLPAGERGSRHAHVSDLLARITGAEAGMVVNNNASAVFLALSSLAAGKDVVVSRGQAVEIGGGFRIPDVLRQSGARLVEVGTTNRTYLADYERAISPETALLLRVHSSNFRLVGFVHEVDLAGLADLGARLGVAVLDDLGSGALLDSTAYGLAYEPMPQESVNAGASLVCFSGDKLLGGPQAGLIVGKRELVERLRRHPLARALRVDKVTLAGMQATLLHYARGEAVEKVPVWRMIATPVEALERRVRAWQATVETWGVASQVADSSSAIGGGSLPGETLPSQALAVTEAEVTRHGLSLDAVATRLRGGRPAVVARIERGHLLFDARTVQLEEEESFLAGLRVALGK